MEEQIKGFQDGGINNVDPFEGKIDLSGIDPNTLRLQIMRMGQPTYEERLKKFQSRLAPYAGEQRRLNFYDVASELGAAILATPATGGVYEGIGRGFANVSARIKANREENRKAEQQVALQAANLAMQDEQKAEDFLQKYSLELLKQSNDPGDLITIEFDEMIPQTDEAGNPVLDDDGNAVLVATGQRKQGTFRDNLANKSVIDELLTQKNGVEVSSPTTQITMGEEGDKEYIKAMIKNEEKITTEARAASGVRDQVAYARSIAERLGQEGYGPQAAFFLPIKKVLVGLGFGGMVDESKVGDQILMNQLGVGFAMAIVGQTKGAISNREMEMFLAASPVLTSTYNGFMKQLDYLERIAKRSEDYAIAYSEKADELERAGISKAQVKRGLDRFAAEWQRNNPLFEPDEFSTLSGVARGEADAISKLGINDENKQAGVAQGYNVNDSFQQYRSIRAAKEPTDGAVKTRATIANDSMTLAETIAKSDKPLEEKKRLLQEMLKNQLSIPDYLIQNFQLETAQ